MSSAPSDGTLLGEATTQTGDARALGEASELPARIGRFVVVEKIGAGGMGVVLMAYDPKLDRRVAIKLIHPSRSADAQAQDRMLREAQALAKLSHPNVVQIYDVGTHGDQVYLAMEFVPGQTLEDWLQRDPPWREVVERFVAAGEGLAAAHAVGLVHRDFKPQNALLGYDGRVRVLDFGLVRVHRLDGDRRVGEDEVTAVGSHSGEWQTKTGELLGTPAFMAPEQFAGEPGDELSDQYNFCASLFRGLWGMRPHPGVSVHAIMESALAGTIVARPRERGVPAEIEDAVLRGLSKDPIDRHASLNDLLARLRGRPAARHRVAWIAAAVLGVSAPMAFAIGMDDDPLERCLDASGEAVAVWAARRDAVETAFVGTQLPYASDTFAGLDARMQDFTRKWTASHEHACRAAHESATQSAAMFDLRVACLQRARTELDAATEVLAGADADVMRRASRIADGLPDLDVCDDAEALAAAIPPPPDEATRTAVAAVRETIARAAALEGAGRYAEALAEAQTAVDAGTAIDYAPLHAETSYRLANVQSSHGDVAAAEASMRATHWRALAEGLDDLGYSTAFRMVEIVGVSGHRFDEAQWWWDAADALRKRAGKDANEEGRLIGLRALLLALRGEHQEALELNARALELADFAPLRLKLLNDRGDLHHRMGDAKAAERTFGEAHEMAVEIYGERHPDSAVPLGNRGMIALMREDYATAVPLIEQAIAVIEPAVAEGNPHLATMYNMLGVAAEQQGHPEEARRHYERALAIREKAFGPEHADVAMILSNLGKVAWVEKDYDEAIAIYTRAIGIYERALGPESPNVAVALTGLASAHWELGQLDDAIPSFERALAIQSRDDIDPNLRARTQFLLARALWDKGDRERATSLARDAHAILSESEGASEPRIALAAWSEEVGLELTTQPPEPSRRP